MTSSVVNVSELPAGSPANLVGVTSAGAAVQMPVSGLAQTANNLADLGDKAAARGNLGLGSVATMNVPGTAATQASATQVVRGDDPRLSDARTPTSHQHTAAQISDATTVGKALATATDAAAARSAIGAGTSSFSGDYADLSNKPTLGSAAGLAAGTVGAALVQAADKPTALTALGLPSGSAFGFRNRIINGAFNINQRGVSGTVTLAAGAYGHDRWKAGASGCTYTFYAVHNVATITITAGTLMQVIEGINLRSGTHVLSWTGTATARIDSGSYGAAGLTGTATGGTNQTIEFATGTVANVQYEQGSISTPFEFRQGTLELTLCKVYYQAISVMCQGYGSGTIYNDFALPVEMRVTPSVAVMGAVSYSNASQYTVNFVSSKKVRLSLNVASGYGYGDGVILLMNAEL